MNVIYDWQSTPALWSAVRPDYCGCEPGCSPRGLGKTRELALADLLEQEEMREEMRQ